jgi:hypothetical protein
VVALSGLNSNEGRRFDDRRWTRGKYTQRAVSWGAFARPTSCEKMEAEGGHTRRLLAKAEGKIERWWLAHGGHATRRRGGPTWTGGCGGGPSPAATRARRRRAAVGNVTREARAWRKGATTGLLWAGLPGPSPRLTVQCRFNSNNFKLNPTDSIKRWTF